MYSAAVRITVIAALAAVAIAYTLTPSRSNRPLDPNEPIAADGSMTAGRAATIYDTNPLLRARLSDDSDDPADFSRQIKADRPIIAADRALFKRLLSRPLDASLCKARDHTMLLLAVRTYYSERTREKRAYALRGPHANAAIQKEWSAPAVAEIDDFVRHAVQYGLLHKGELRSNFYAEFDGTVADIQELGTGCTAADRP
jgi:hypothetical protein